MRTASGVACQRRIWKWDLDRDFGTSMVATWMKDLSSRISARLPNGKPSKESGRNSTANLNASRNRSAAWPRLNESTPTRFERQSQADGRATQASSSFTILILLAFLRDARTLAH